MHTVLWIIAIELALGVLLQLYRAGQGGYFKSERDCVFSAIEGVVLVIWLLVVFL